MFARFLKSPLLLLTGITAVLGATYSNPLEAKDGGDPSIVFHDGFYYLTATNFRDLRLRRATTLEGLKTAEPKVIWSPDSPQRQCNIWAPELHSRDGTWYIYFSAGGCGTTDIQQSQVLIGGASPWDDFRYFDTINAPDWSIDGTPLSINGKDYFVYSCFRNDTGERLQSLCIGEITSVTQMGPEFLLSSPTNDWERIGPFPVNEGAFAIYREGRTFLSFSASYCGTANYTLALLSYNGGDPLQASSWTKSGPQFASANGNFGTGHNSFFTSPDGSEVWMAYHSTPSEAGSCGDRYANAKKIDFQPDGTPILGTPIPVGEVLPGPAGEP
ncbi:glycosyl hydrolases family 43 protein [Elsinoe australis]|uniref:Glycosyl hydrolases family 43 protein n=1 Tax=Elsinoe australis TaxID=40998 RepID=A0A4U7ASK5_9PEZI|nr:glycosyl hydrolases family 43 protein [Elsinoe australis]